MFVGNKRLIKSFMVAETNLNTLSYLLTEIID